MPDQYIRGDDHQKHSFGKDRSMGAAQARMKLPNVAELHVPQAVIDYPSMTTESEKKLLYWLAKNYYCEDALIVDVGIFLGGSTNAFATGIIDNTAMSHSFEKPIHSYDIAVWVEGMNKYLEFDGVKQALGGVVLRNGDSFEAILRRLLQPHNSVVDLKIGNILETAREEDPIEIAFYDCLKTNERDIAIFKCLIQN